VSTPDSRVGLVSDVHANLPALEAALGELRRRRVRDVVVAGDLVGYGAQPNECVTALAEVGATCVLGNHDLCVLGILPPDRFPPYAREAAARTRLALGRDEWAYLAAQPRTRRVGGLLVAHGSPDDPEEYVTDVARARELLAALPSRAPGADTLVLGHTHRQWIVSGDAVRHGAGTFLLGDAPRLVNPGSTGQSRVRERRPGARLSVLDPAAERVEQLAIPYDVEAARRALRAWGLPDRCLHAPPSFRRRLGRWRRRLVGTRARPRSGVPR
jgi:predicted phosphodiesterase